MQIVGKHVHVVVEGEHLDSLIVRRLIWWIHVSWMCWTSCLDGAYNLAVVLFFGCKICELVPERE